MTKFKELGLNPDLMKSLDDLGFVEPSPIQEKAIPFILKSKKNLIALAQTGTGKTAAFSLPILNQIKGKNLEAIIICPTRELCIQISEDVSKLSKYSKDISVTPVYGGERIDIQIRALRKGTNIVVGTPGRVHDLIRRRILNLSNIKWLVLDEADEMLDMGFKDDLDAILEKTPEEKQTLLFSATISKSVHTIAKRYMDDAEEISVGEKNIGAENVSHEYYVIQTKDRFEALQRIIDSIPGVYGILFCRTRNQTQELADKLKQANYDTEALHGDVSQVMRTKIMDRFKKKKVKLLVATDVAARGIDVSDLSHVINYNLPDQNEVYTHRSGRTGRAQKSGVSISLVTPRDVRQIHRLEDIIGKTFEHKKIPTGKDVCKMQIDGFMKEIEEVDVKDISNEEHFKELIEKLDKINKEDLIKYFVINKFGYLMNSNKHARDLNAHVGKADSEAKSKRLEDENAVNLEINIGKTQGFDVRGVFFLINSNDKLKGAEIGRINLTPEYSIFSIEKKYADEAIKQLSGSIVNGQEIEIKKSDRVENYQRKRSNRSFKGGQSRGRQRKKRDFRRR